MSEKGGSSPLARGLLQCLSAGVGGCRIIPARAGFTSRLVPRMGAYRDHPRSRGVYLFMQIWSSGDPGSSPLARGLREPISRKSLARRIIPARAGFTHGSRPRGSGFGDHPRSRGVYLIALSASICSNGSSPLARGLRSRSGDVELNAGIIPARAGFTSLRAGWSALSWDHPRSRGVYLTRWVMPRIILGSSPLARGLQSAMSLLALGHGIIPARAGFTSRAMCPPTIFTDHPRSRGVYSCGSLESQRTRTLPDPCCLHCRPRVRSAELR